MAARNSERFWAQHITSVVGSGMSKAAYCRLHGLDYRTFYRWYRRLGGEAAGGSTQGQALVPIAVRSPALAAEPVMRLQLGGGASLSIPVGVDVNWLAHLLREVAAC